MITFFISVIVLVLGFLLYGKFVEWVFGPDPARSTPAYTKADGVDYIALPTWKVFMIQFLNIAGTEAFLSVCECPLIYCCCCSKCEVHI